MSRVFAFVTVLLLALAFLLAEEAPARAGGEEQYGDGGSSSGGGGALLQRLAERHGVSRGALDRLVHSLEMGALPVGDVTHGVPRTELLAVVRDVIATDGVADPKELELADALARKLA